MLIILKIGGSIITDKSSKKPKVNKKNLERISKEISESYSPEKFKLVLIHGAGSYGHQIVNRTGIDKGIKDEKQLLDFAETQRLQNKLNTIVTKKLIKEGVPAFPCQASVSAIMESGKLIEMDIEAIKHLIDIGLVPVLFGVPAYDKDQKCSILSGDQIAPYLAKKMKADRIIHATNVDGIFTADPKKDENAELIPEVSSKNIEEVKKYLSSSSDIDVTGGMFGKVKELMNIGIKSQIISALVPENISKALRGESIGTIIRSD